MIILLAIIILSSLSNNVETFTNYTLADAVGEYPEAETNVLVQDSYPLTGNKGVSNETAEKMWKRYPIFEVGSYAQITNNIRYPDNPDDARCTPADMCYALYANNKNKLENIEPLPPVNPNCGTRIGYFSTNITLFPLIKNSSNVLY